MTGSKDSSGENKGPVIKDTMKKPLPKRFYKSVAVDAASGAHVIVLDGRRAHTPGKRPLMAPSLTLAERMADEWRAQKDVIDPGTMPLTTLTCTTLDAVAGREEVVAADIVRYAGSDLLCYRADTPAKLVARQAAAWDPVLQWARTALGAEFTVTTGLMHVTQPPAAQNAIAAAIKDHDAFPLAALHVLTTIMGSAVLAVAVGRKHLALHDAWAAAHVDEDWQIEQWGSDSEAEARRAKRLRDAEAAAFVLSALAR